MSAPLSTLDVLIVLGARLNPEGQPGRIARMRLAHALQVWRECCPEGYVLLTGGCTGGSAVSESQAMARWALNWAEENWGPAAREQLEPRLLLEEASLNTAASARNTLPLLLELKVSGVGLISDALHLRRAHFLFRRHFARHHLTLHPLPVPGVLRHYWRRRRFLWLGKMALREAGAWLKALGKTSLRWKR